LEGWRARRSETVDILIRAKKTNQGLFFAHLALEKALKALVSRATENVPPFIHNLERLAELSAIEYSDDYLELFRSANRFCIKGRYEVPSNPIAPDEESRRIAESIKEAVKWLNER